MLDGALELTRSKVRKQARRGEVLTPPPTPDPPPTPQHRPRELSFQADQSNEGERSVCGLVMSFKCPFLIATNTCAPS